MSKPCCLPRQGGNGAPTLTGERRITDGSPRSPQVRKPVRYAVGLAGLLIAALGWPAGCGSHVDQSSPSVSLDASMSLSPDGSSGASGSNQGGTPDANYADAVDASLADAGDSAPSCTSHIEKHPIEGHAHIVDCSAVTYQTNPPSSGNHYAVWGAYKFYSSPLPRGFYVHNLEHGAIVITYNCQHCEDQIAALQAWVNAQPADPSCAAPVKHRVLVTPDPQLDVPFAASAWGWTLRASCFDPVAFGAFFTDHYNHGSEDLCSDGEDVVATGFPANCGTQL